MFSLKRNKVEDRSKWSTERWYQHALDSAFTESERQEIHAIFSRHYSQKSAK